MAKNLFTVSVYDDHFVVGQDGSLDDPIVVYNESELGARLKYRAGLEEKKPRKKPGRRARAALPGPPPTQET